MTNSEYQIKSPVAKLYSYSAINFGGLILSSVYLGMMFWFAHANIWHDKFNTPGLHYLGYNIVRLFFIGFMIMSLAGSGMLLRTNATKNVVFSVSAPEQFILDFFLGAAMWIIFMYFLGVVGGYYWLPLLILSALPIYFYYPYLRNNLVSYSHLPNHRMRIDYISIILLLLILAALLPMIIFLSGLSISNFGYDSSHYLAYYDQVITHHGTAPNDLWYHFWVSKGAGLQFLSILLLDIQAPQLVSTVFLIMTSLLLFLFVKSNFDKTESLGLAFIIIFLGPFLSDHIYQQKLHIITLGLMSGLIWMLILSLRQTQENQRYWFLLLSILAGAATLHTPPLAALLLTFFAFCWCIETAQTFLGKKSNRNFILFPFTAVLGCLLCVFTINYFWTGMAEVTPFRFFFNYANQEKLNHYFSPYLIMLISEWLPKEIGTLNVKGIFNLKISNVNWLGIINGGPLPATFLYLFPILIKFSVISMICPSIRKRYFKPFLYVALLIISSALVALITHQPESMSRFYLFNYALFLMLLIISVSCLLSFLKLLPFLGKESSIVLIISMFSLFCASTGLNSWIPRYLHHERTRGVTPPSSLAFLIGKQSLEDDVDHSKFNSSPSCTEMANAAYTLAAKEGTPNVRPKIWTLPMVMEVGCYTLPTARIMMELSNSFGNHWHRIVFGTAKEAKAELKALDVAYFYVDLAETDLNKKIINSSLLGCLGYSDLFDPKTIRSNFRVAWKNGDKYLLVFADKKQGALISNDFIKKWTNKTAQDEAISLHMKSTCTKTKEYYQKNGEHWPIVLNS